MWLQRSEADSVRQSVGRIKFVPFEDIHDFRIISRVLNTAIGILNV